MSQFVAALDGEIEELTTALSADLRFRRLVELQRIRRELYGETSELANGFAVAFKTASRMGRKPSPERQRVLDEVRSLMQSYNGPVPTTTLLEYLRDVGIQIGGEEPRNTLSAMLSNSQLFVSNGRAGWTIKNNEELEEPEQSSAEMEVRELDRRFSDMMRRGG